MEKLVSIIIPVYNCEKYLVPLVESVLAQTYDNIEVLLINDGSTDHSLQICDQFAEADHRVRVNSIPNSGSSVARNVGIAMAKGEFIMFADGDDLVDKTMVEDLMTALIESAVRVSVGLNRKSKADGTVLKVGDNPDGKTYILQGEDKLHFIFEHVSPCAKLFQRSIFDKYFFCKAIIHQDFDLIPKIVYEEKKIAFVSKQLYTYYIRDDGITGNNQKIRKPDLFIIIDKSISEYYYNTNFIMSNELDRFIAEYLLHGYSRFKRVIALGERKKQKVYIKAYCECYKKHMRVIWKNKTISNKEKVLMILGAYSPWVFEKICLLYLHRKE